MYELIEIDPQTGDADQLLGTGTMRQMERQMQTLIADMDAEWGELDVDRYGVVWSALRIQPAGTATWN
ncbi:hypothetical protein [Actinoplanes sp. NPDC048796]|uniref:hypothetical protein n=1 Tax=Actinoplanes sp. NPDC048796 TaxID=3155640 RepID=UPI0033F19A59